MTLGFDNLDEYVDQSPYFGSITGRYANRIANGQFTLDGDDYQLPINNDPNTSTAATSGSTSGCGRAEEIQRRDSVGLRLTYTSPDGEEGYPGKLDGRGRPTR